MQRAHGWSSDFVPFANRRRLFLQVPQSMGMKNSRVHPKLHLYLFVNQQFGPLACVHLGLPQQICTQQIWRTQYVSPNILRQWFLSKGLVWLFYCSIPCFTCLARDIMDSVLCAGLCLCI